MGGLRRWALAAAVAGLVGCATPATGVPSTDQDPAGRHQPPAITVTDITAGGVTIESARTINQRGQVVVDVVREDGSGESAIWRHGRLTDLFPEETSGTVAALSDRGQAVGTYRLPGDELSSCPRLFSWRRGELTELPVGPAAGTLFCVTAFGVNNRDQIIGFPSVFMIGPAGAFIWDTGELVFAEMTVDSDSHYRLATDINDRGQALLVGDRPAIREPDGRIVDLRTGEDWVFPLTINERGHVVGQAGDLGTGEFRAFLWRDGEMTDLGTLGGTSSEAVAVNDRGDVVGNSETADGSEHAFLWRDGQMIDLGTLPAPLDAGSEVVAVNNRGQVVGISYERTDDSGPPVNPQAFLWQDGRMTNLSDVITPGVPSQPRAINDRGEITGHAAWELDENDQRQGGRPVLWTAPPPRRP